MEFPELKFVELKGKTEEDLDDYIENNAYGEYLVYLRQKYDWEKEWEYLIEFCFYDFNCSCVCWWMDWNEGQQNVEYLAIMKIK